MGRGQFAPRTCGGIHHHYGSAGREFLRLWDAATRRVFDLQGHPKGAWGLVFSPNGRRLVAASRWELFLWNTVDEQPIDIQHRSADLDNIIRDITFSPDSQLLATAEGKTVQVWITP